MDIQSAGSGKKRLTWKFVTIAAVVFFVGAGVYYLLDSTSDSKRLEQNLIDQYGYADSYVPTADGRIAADRIERFIRVRQAVQASCADYREVLDGVLGLASIETEPGISGREAASRGIKGFKSIMHVGPIMLRFMDARNRALLAEEMGIGEYMYLYIAAYGPQIADAPSSPYVDMEEAYISERARLEFTGILNNQLSRPDIALDDPSRTLIEQEIKVLEEGTRSSPWPDGPPSPTRDSLTSYETEISSLHCEGIVAIELLQKNRGFNLGG